MPLRKCLSFHQHKYLVCIFVNRTCTTSAISNRIIYFLEPVQQKPTESAPSILGNKSNTVGSSLFSFSSSMPTNAPSSQFSFGNAPSTQSTFKMSGGPSFSTGPGLNDSNSTLASLVSTQTPLFNNKTQEEQPSVAQAQQQDQLRKQQELMEEKAQKLKQQQDQQRKEMEQKAAAEEQKQKQEELELKAKEQQEKAEQQQKQLQQAVSVWMELLNFQSFCQCLKKMLKNQNMF